MRLCTDCWHLNVGEKPFCQNCGCSFNVKLCPHKHVNPRAAKVCAECGSSDLSRPQRKPPLYVRPVLFILFDIGPGILLVGALIVFLGFYIQKLLSDPNGLLPLMLVGAALGSVLYLWILFHASRKRGKGRGAK